MTACLYVDSPMSQAASLFTRLIDSFLLEFLWAKETFQCEFSISGGVSPVDLL